MSDTRTSTASADPGAATDLVPPESRDRIGSVLAGPVTFTIEQREAQRYAHAVGDDNPVYFDEAAAVAAGFRTLTVPHTFVTHALVPPRPLADLRTDGLYRDGTGVRLNVSRMMFGGEEWDFDEPVCVGDEVTATTRLAALDEKAGSKGPFVRIVRETTYVNQHGDRVARNRQIGIAR